MTGPDFRPYHPTAEFLSHSPSLRLHMPRQGANRASQRPLSRLPLSTHAPSTPHIGPRSRLSRLSSLPSHSPVSFPFAFPTPPYAQTGGHQGHSTPPVQASTQHPWGPCTQHPAHSTQHPSWTHPHTPSTQHKALGTAMEVKGTQLERGGVVSAWRVGLEMPLHPKGHLCFVVGKILALKTPPTYWPT